MAKRRRGEILKAALEVTSNIIPSEHVLKRVPERYREESLSLLETTNAWSAGPNIVGYGIARKRTLGKQFGEPCLKIYVKKKLPKHKLPAKRQVPSSIKLFDQSEEIVTDVEEIGVIKPQVYDGRYRPALPGCAISHIQGKLGTLGCVVSRDGNRFVLSCSHVVAKSGEAAVGDLILQPSGVTMENNAIGRLAEFIPFDFSPSPREQVDAGLVFPFDDSLISETFVDGTLVQGSRFAREGLPVQLIGFVSGHTFGQVIDVFFTFSMKYSTGIARFRNQILCTKMSTEGDSGSLLLSSDNQAVGLLIGGSVNTSVCNPIGSVLRKLNVEIRQ